MDTITRTLIGFLLLLTVLSHLSDACNYGCPFREAPFHLVQQEDVFDPQFGAVRPALNFQNGSDLDTFLSKLSLAIIETLHVSVIDESLDFLNFYGYYKYWTKYGYDINRIYYSFTLKYREHSLLSLLHYIVEKLVYLTQGGIPVRESFYFVTAETKIAPWIQAYYVLHQNGTGLDVTSFFEHNHFAGAIRVNVNGVISFILIDPLLPEQRIFVVQQRGGYTEGISLAPVYTYKSIGSYIIVTKAVDDEILYYVEQPYCSMIQTTVKGNLITQTGSILKYCWNNLSAKIEQLEKISFSYSIYTLANPKIKINDHDIVLGPERPVEEIIGQNATNRMQQNLQFGIENLSAVLDGVRDMAYDATFQNEIDTVKIIHRTTREAFSREATELHDDYYQ